MLLGGLPNHQTTPINTTTMSKKRHTKEAQIKAIREHESGRSQAEICKELNITAQTFYRWKKQLGMMTDAGLGRLALEAVFTAYPAHLAQADVQAEGPDLAEDLAVALGRHAVGQLDDDLADLRRRRAQARTVAESVAVCVQRPADEPLGGRRYQRPDRRGRELRGDLQGDLPDLPRA